MGFTLGSLMALRLTQTGSFHKTQERQPVRHISRTPGRTPTPGICHGAVHDKSDDKLNLIKYDWHTRISGGSKRDIGVRQRVWSRSEGGKSGGAINRSHSVKKTNLRRQPV
jgi:hypothetical protein